MLSIASSKSHKHTAVHTRTHTYTRTHTGLLGNELSSVAAAELTWNVASALKHLKPPSEWHRSQFSLLIAPDLPTHTHSHTNTHAAVPTGCCPFCFFLFPALFYYHAAAAKNLRLPQPQFKSHLNSRSRSRRRRRSRRRCCRLCHRQHHYCHTQLRHSRVQLQLVDLLKWRMQNANGKWRRRATLALTAMDVDESVSSRQRGCEEEGTARREGSRGGGS